MLRLERVAFGRGDSLTGARSNIFTSPEWVEFVAATQKAEPVVARVLRGEEHVGWFMGLVVRRFGVRILGSPFAGWMTGPMGFDLDPGVSRREAAQALIRFAFKDLRCLHLEMIDRRAVDQDLEGLGAERASWYTLEIDLTQDEDTLLKGLASSCRRALKKAEREGVRVEEAHGVEFADEYYEQLLDVFAKQGGRPPYDVERVRNLIRCLEPAGNLLLLRAVGPGESGWARPSSRSATTSPTSGAGRAGASTRRIAPTSRSSGMRCGASRSAGFRCWTWAAGATSSASSGRRSGPCRSCGALACPA